MINAYRARAAVLRSKLTGGALAESQLSPEQHAQFQEALAEKGFLRPYQVGSGTHDGEFGPITRNAIKQLQQSLGASTSGFLSNDQWSALLENTEGGGIASTPPPPPAPAPTPPQVVMVPAPAPQPPRPAIIIDTHSWIKIGEHATGTYYMGTDSMIRKGDIVTILDLEDYHSSFNLGDSPETFSSMKNMIQYNCLSARSRIVWGQVFSGQLGMGKLLVDGSATAHENVFDTGSDDLLAAKGDDWVPMPDEAIMRKERDIACNATAPPPKAPCSSHSCGFHMPGTETTTNASHFYAPAAKPEVEPAKPEKTDAEKETKATARDAAKTNAEDAETYVPLEHLRAWQVEAPIESLMSNGHERPGLTGITVEITESRLGAMIGLTRESGFMCKSVSAASAWFLSRGFTLICDNYAHKYDISDEGGTWVVKVSHSIW